MTASPGPVEGSNDSNRLTGDGWLREFRNNVRIGGASQPAHYAEAAGQFVPVLHDDKNALFTRKYAKIRQALVACPRLHESLHLGHNDEEGSLERGHQPEFIHFFYPLAS
jgi:hypothetical protein